MGLAWRMAEAPLRRAERAASCAMEFMMRAGGIGDEEGRFEVVWVLVLMGEGRRKKLEDSSEG